uniref:PH domain-containing protein n=1 Tax=Astyanax mexicanus TaxID=7994 RepID=A0A3B1KIZ7_ASTMX
KKIFQQHGLDIMAVVSATSNGSTEKRLEEAEGGKSGWLSKKTQFTRRWRPAWFQIQESRLIYGGNDRRTFFLRAGSAEEQQEWMVAICEAQMSSGEHSSNACVVQ